MKKRILSALLAVMLVAAFAGCGSETPASATGSGSTVSTSEASKAESVNSETPSGEPQKLVMTFLTWTGAPADVDTVETQINELLRSKFNVEIDMQIYDMGTYKQSMTLALAGGEQIDIMNGVTLGYPNLVAQGYLLDLEENDLLATYGSGITDAIQKDFIDACRINGVLYGLPQNRDMAVGRGSMAVVTDDLTAVGYTAPADAGEIIKISEAEVNDLLAKIHEKFPDKEVFRPTTTNSFSQYSDVDLLGGNVFGVLLDYGKELTVENLFTSDAYMEYCQLMYDWNQKGYINQDAATDTTAVANLVKAGTLSSYTTGGKPGSKQQESSMGIDMTIFQTKEDFVSSSAVASFPWSIPLNTVDAELSMKVLNEFYTNADLETLLIYGIKDTHYTLAEEGLAEIILDESGTASYSTLGWLAPNQFISYALKGNSADLWKETEAFNSTAQLSAASGFSFDSTNVATEMAALQNVYDEYQKSVEFGFVDPATALPEMNSKMMDSGLQKVIDEKQAQLDAWAASK